jgi:hypothetical protein
MFFQSNGESRSAAIACLPPAQEAVTPPLCLVLQAPYSAGSIFFSEIESMARIERLAAASDANRSAPTRPLPPRKQGKPNAVRLGQKPGHDPNLDSHPFGRVRIMKVS